MIVTAAYAAGLEATCLGCMAKPLATSTLRWALRRFVILNENFEIEQRCDCFKGSFLRMICKTDLEKGDGAFGKWAVRYVGI
jgi:hypothetical protein